MPPPANPETDRFQLLSRSLRGVVVQPVWFREPQEVEKLFGPGSYPVFRRGHFEYHWFLGWKYTGFMQKVAALWFCIKTGFQLHRQERFDCIVVYSHMATGLCGVVLKLLTGAPLITEIATVPHLAAVTQRPRPTWKDRIKKLYSDISLHVTVLSSDRTHLLYPDQLKRYRLLQRKPAAVFHEFVPTSAVPRRVADDAENFVLFVGAPWYLKGVDVLIRAFRNLAADYPSVRLKLMGHFPDRAALDAIAGGEDRIQILAARPNRETLDLISRARVLVLPSRCEGMGRVLLEAMAAGVPVIGSDVGGIPYLVRHGQDGYVVPVGEVHELESRLRELLSTPVLRQRFGESGYERAQGPFGEDAYADQFTAMVRAAVRK